MDVMEVQIISQVQPLRETTYHGQRYVGGELGQTYAIQIRNTNPGRCEFVVTVDGLNVQDKSPGSIAGAGLVLQSNSTHVIKGWRKSLDDVAEFVLTSPEQSYAAKTGESTASVGVIAVAVFSEQQRRREVLRGVTRGGTARPVPARASLGTGHGERVESRVGTTTFNRASTQPESVVEIHYDSTANLIELGVLPCFVPRKLQAFPGDVPAVSFCPDPGD